MKRILLWGAVGIIVAAAAAMAAKHFWTADPQDPPGIIFERADRPAKV